jgi:hypothetical protein
MFEDISISVSRTGWWTGGILLNIKLLDLDKVFFIIRLLYDTISTAEVIQHQMMLMSGDYVMILKEAVVYFYGIILPFA